MQENKSYTARDPGDHVHEALMPQLGESHDDYLTRGCRYTSSQKLLNKYIKAQNLETVCFAREPEPVLKCLHGFGLSFRERS